MGYIMKIITILDPNLCLVFSNYIDCIATLQNDLSLIYVFAFSDFFFALSKHSRKSFGTQKNGTRIIPLFLLLQLFAYYVFGTGLA